MSEFKAILTGMIEDLQDSLTEHTAERIYADPVGNELFDDYVLIHGRGAVSALQSAVKALECAEMSDQ